ncbi:MAG: hypothetical protein WBH01_03820 [Dehalococcoidia bacterium]
MNEKRGAQRMREEKKRILRLERRLKRIESRLEDIGRQLEEGSKRSLMAFRVGIGFAGLGFALGLSITSPVWNDRELRPSEFSFPLLAISLAVIYWSFVGVVGDYRKGMGIIGTLLMVMGPVALTVSNVWVNVSRINIGLIGLVLFLVGGCVLGISVMLIRGKKQGEVAEE